MGLSKPIVSIKMRVGIGVINQPVALKDYKWKEEQET